MIKTKNKIIAPVCEAGIVEGFFGPPWTHAGRRALIAEMPRMGFSTYIYAPKDDLCHRIQWNRHYSPDEFARLASLIGLCNSVGVDFVWAVSPGLTIRHAKDADFEILADKFGRIADKGVRSFALFLDDIPKELINKADRERFASLADAHVYIANRLYERLMRMRPDARLFFCPTDYYTIKPTPYLLTIGEKLHPDISVFWTGPKVVPPAITAADARAITAILRRKPLLWDNYPVNDYNRRKLNLGPLRGRDPKLPGLLGGYFANPMNEPRASAIPLMTASDFLRDPAGYDPDASWRRAVRTMAGGDSKTAAALAEFCDAWPAALFPNEPLCGLERAVEAARNGSPAELKKKLDRAPEAWSVIDAAPALKEFVAETQPFANGLLLYAEAAKLAVGLRGKPADGALRARLVNAFFKANQTTMHPARQSLRQFILETLER
ncbi:MAG: protein O-GlcNAcase [bacterium]